MNALSHRSLVPEILDGLAADDPRALASRRDLRRINALMFQARIMASLLRKFAPKPPRRILEMQCALDPPSYETAFSIQKQKRDYPDKRRKRGWERCNCFKDFSARKLKALEKERERNPDNQRRNNRCDRDKQCRCERFAIC